MSGSVASNGVSRLASDARPSRDSRLVTHGWRLTSGVWQLLGLLIWVAAGLPACFSEHETTAAVEGVCNVELAEGVPGSTLVVIDRFTFGPSEVRVRAGDRVTWINCDQESHTSTAQGGQWASPLLAPGQVFTHTFSAVGDFPYFCEPHPFMTGRVIVE